MDPEFNPGGNEAVAQPPNNNDLDLELVPQAAPQREDVQRDEFLLFNILRSTVRD